MIWVFLRTLVTGLIVWVLMQGADAVAQASPGKPFPGVQYVLAALVLAWMAGFLWAPWVGECLAGTLTSELTQADPLPDERRIPRWIRAAEGRKWRRLVLWLCLLEILRRPRRPAVWRTGLKHAREGTWLQAWFARGVYRFQNAFDCLDAYEVLKRHGKNVPPHPVPEVERRLLLMRTEPPPERVPMPLPQAPQVQSLRRDSRIQLPQGMDPIDHGGEETEAVAPDRNVENNPGHG